jgi:4-amino-4-deoxy-L-arabinose transferase-like glycosyltransferase
MAGIAGKDFAAVDDADVISMSTDATVPLLPVLERSRALRPLIVVLAVLPGFVALERHGLDDFSSVWALRALSSFQSGTVGDLIDPGETGRTAALASQPPLATWLTALVLAVVGPINMHAPLIVPLLATAGCVWWTFRLFGEVAGPRRGFWAAVLAASNGTLLLLATNTAPTALALFLALAAFDAWMRHFRQRKGNISVWLLLSGTAVGLELLAGGPIAIAVFAVLILKPILDRVFPAAPPQQRRYGRHAGKAPRLAVALGVVLLTALAIGGWWIMQAAAADPAFWRDWLNGYEAPTLAVAGTATQAAQSFPPGVARAVRVCVVVGPILPLCIYGLFLLVLRRAASRERATAFPAGRESGKSGRQESSESPALLVSWLIVAAGYHALEPGWEAGLGTGRTLADSFLVIPAIGLAAYAVDAILQRQTTVWEVFLLTAAMFAVLPVLPSWERGLSPLTEPLVAIAVGLFALSALIGWRLRHWIREREFRKRVALGAMMTAQLAATITGSAMGLSSSLPDDARLDPVRAKLQSEAVVTQIVLITDAVPPARLEYMLRSVYPNARWHTVGVRTVTAEVGDVLAGTDARHDVLFVEWTSVARQTALAEIRGRKLVAVGTPRFYRGRELRASLLKPQDETQMDGGMTKPE